MRGSLNRFERSEIRKTARRSPALDAPTLEQEAERWREEMAKDEPCVTFNDYGCGSLWCHDCGHHFEEHNL